MDTLFIERRLNQLISEAATIPGRFTAARNRAYCRITRLAAMLSDDWAENQIEQFIVAGNYDDADVLLGVAAQLEQWRDAASQLRGTKPALFVLA